MSYAITGYSRASYSGGPTFGAIFLAGASVTAAPSGSNMPAPMKVGLYGAFAWSSSVVKTASKQIPVRFGKNVGFVSLVDVFRPIALGSTTAVGPAMPAYGN